MLSIAIGIYTVYILINIYVGVMQIGYLSQAKKGNAVLLAADEFVEAAQYSISKHRLGLVTSIIEFAMFMLWMGFGISWLNTEFLSFSPTVHMIGFVLGFIMINSVVGLPFEIYQKLP